LLSTDAEGAIAAAHLSSTRSVIAPAIGRLSVAKEAEMIDQDREHHARVRASGIAGHVCASEISFTCQVDELSEDGAFLLTDQRLAVGENLVIAFVKPGGRKALRIKGRVSRAVGGGVHHHPGLDVDFTSVEKADAQRLVDWLGEMTRRAGGRAKAPINIPEKVVSRAPAAAPAVQTLEARADASSQQEAKLILQIKDFSLEQDHLREQLRLRDAEIDELRRALATAEKLIGLRRHAD
jgi:hypothetical protein